jgi:hypothetical protein
MTHTSPSTISQQPASYHHIHSLHIAEALTSTLLLSFNEVKTERERVYVDDDDAPSSTLDGEELEINQVSHFALCSPQRSFALDKSQSMLSKSYRDRERLPMI